MARKKKTNGRDDTEVTLADLHRAMVDGFANLTDAVSNLTTNVSALTDRVDALADRVDVLAQEQRQTNIELKADHRRLLRVEDRVRKIERTSG